MKRTISILLILVLFVSLLLQVPTIAKEYPQTRYEAEAAVLSGVQTNTDHAGYTGTGFVDHFDAKGDFVEFSVDLAEAGDYSFLIRYANAGGYYASAKVFFDGVFEATAVFPSLASWDEWSTSEVGKYLTAGTHTVRIAYNNHAINIDSLTVEEKHESTRSLYLSNAKDMMAIWQSTQLCSEDAADNPAGIRELHVSSSWGENQIRDYSGFFRDETGAKDYSSGELFDVEGYFDETGILRTNYLEYDGVPTAGIEISRNYCALPNMPVLLTQYSIKNTSAGSKRISVLDMLNPANTGTSAISASYSDTQNAIIFDRSSAGMPYLALGTWGSCAGFQVANDADSNTASSSCSPWYTFHSSGSVANNRSASANAVSGAFLKTAELSAGASCTLYGYVAYGATLADLNQTVSSLNARDGSDWLTYTQTYYGAWLEDGKAVPSFSNPELAKMYKRNLIMIKNTLRPGSTTGDGAHVATTNPYDYGYKVWTRDASVTAIALDAAGFTTEGAQYWRWLAARQLTSGETAGSFNTCIDVWSNQRAEFIEPEHDTNGWFLYGVYRHCLETSSTQLRDELWPQLTAAANYVMNNIDSNGFGPQDFSIFEDMDNYGVYTYTQALYAAGLEAMGKMAAQKGLQGLADSYNGAASTIKSAINRDDTLANGLWYPKGKYFIKDIRWDNSVSRIKDGAGLILFTTGIIDINSSRARDTISAFEADLLDDEYGMARYAMDTYYSKDSIYSPSGDEAVEVSPSWPQISNWNAICSAYTGDSQKAENIFDWNLHRTCAGYMFTGECVSDVTEKPCVSTATEPTTAASFILAALVWNGDLDMRIIPDRSNAGCYKELAVHDGCEGDWTQYEFVPYYLDACADAVSSDLSIQKVYITNDMSNLYIRVDNESGSLPAYCAETVFQVGAHIRSSTESAAGTTSTLNGTSLPHSFSKAFVRSSDSTTVDRYEISGSAWAFSNTESGARVEWSPAAGRIQMVIPLESIGAAVSETETWLDCAVSIGSGGTDSDVFEIHYRLTGSSQQWLYGDFE